MTTSSLLHQTTTAVFMTPMLLAGVCALLLLVRTIAARRAETLLMRIAAAARISLIEMSTEMSLQPQPVAATPIAVPDVVHHVSVVRTSAERLLADAKWHAELGLAAAIAGETRRAQKLFRRASTLRKLAASTSVM